MGHIVCITSQKGGVGKTTTAVNLAVAFAVAEKGALLVDCDPQGHATIGLGVDGRRADNSLYDALLGRISVKEAIHASGIEYLQILPSRFNLCRVEFELGSNSHKEFLLRDLLHEIRNAYDYIIIDSPPALNLLAVNAMNAADYLLLPLQCEFYALEGLSYQLSIIKAFREKMNPQIKIAGIVLTMFDGRVEDARRIAAAVRNNFQEWIFKTAIPRNEKLKETAGIGALFLRDIMSPGARSYLALAREVMSRCAV